MPERSYFGETGYTLLEENELSDILHMSKKSKCMKSLLNVVQGDVFHSLCQKGHLRGVTWISEGLRKYALFRGSFNSQMPPNLAPDALSYGLKEDRLEF